MDDLIPSFEPHPDLSDDEKRRLVAEALAPPTGQEREQMRDGVRARQVDHSLRAHLRELAGRVSQWQQRALVEAVARGVIPAWALKPERLKEVPGLMRDLGIHFAGSGFHWELRKGEQVLSVLDIKVNGKAV